MPRSRLKLISNQQGSDNITPDMLVKSFWVSTSLALILTLPPLGIFLAIFQNSDNIVMATIIGFGIHFIILALSEKISSSLIWLLSS